MARKIDKNKLQQVFGAISEFHYENGYSPTIREIMDATGISSTSMVSFYLKKLRDAGAIDFVDGSPRTITIIDKWENALEDGKKLSELVLEERKKGNVVFIAVDSLMSSPIKEIVKQPVDGLLWDLNRLEETALTFMDKKGMIHWVNNFAVALVIRELKKQIDEQPKQEEQ